MPEHRLLPHLRSSFALHQGKAGTLILTALLALTMAAPARPDEAPPYQLTGHLILGSTRVRRL